MKGTLVLQSGPGAHVAVKDLKVDNQGWEWVALPEDSASEAEELRMRGFKVGWRTQCRTAEGARQACRTACCCAL